MFLTIVVGDVVVILHFFDDSWAYLRNYLTRCFFCDLFICARFFSSNAEAKVVELIRFVLVGSLL